ncbi:MAG: PilZ domain-containing protein [Clostridia bacterium]|nr:PilZ domain-containing protein [Clostridia bacterium]
MSKLKISSGTKIDLQLIKDNEKKVLALKSTFEKNVDDVSLLISAPLHKGKYIIFEQFDKLSIKYYQVQTKHILFGYIEDYVQIGLRNYWQVHMVSEERQFVRRAHERIKALLRVSYNKYAGENTFQKQDKMYALSRDISAGGISLRINRYLEPKEIIEVTLPPLGKIKSFSQKVEARWIMATENNKAFSYVAGFRFIFKNSTEKENLKAYVSSLIIMNK